MWWVQICSTEQYAVKQGICRFMFCFAEYTLSLLLSRLLFGKTYCLEEWEPWWGCI